VRKAEQLGEIRVAGEAIAVRLDPVGMLDSQRFVDLLPSLEVARQETVNLSENTARLYSPTR
jgi:hypothetical protein